MTGVPSLEAVKRAGPVAVLGLGFLILCLCLHGAFEKLGAANERMSMMQDTWLRHIDHEMFCPKEGQ